MKNEITDKEQVENNSEAFKIDRRDFIVTSAMAAVGAGAAGLLGPFSAQAAGTASTKNLGQGPYPTEGMAVYSATAPLRPFKFERRALGPKDVAIKLHYCGICHSDIHHGHEDWKKETFPLVPGHELAGVVAAVGSSVSKFKVETVLVSAAWSIPPPLRDVRLGDGAILRKRCGVYLWC